MAMALLSVEELSVTYEHHGHTTRVVDQVSFSIEVGEWFALVGESGSGKSTTALALTGLLPSSAHAAASAIRFEGRDLHHMPERELRAVRGRRIAYVFQDPATSLNPVLTIGEQICEVLSLHAGRRGADAEAAAAEWLRRVGIAEPRLAAYPHEFSGGMQQRVMLAMAMAAEPALLIADEPTSALDVTVQVQLLRLLRGLQRQFGLAVLLITHDLLIVERLAQRMAVMERGRLVEQGRVPEVFQRPQHPATRRLLDARARLSFRRRGASND